MLEKVQKNLPQDSLTIIRTNSINLLTKVRAKITMKANSKTREGYYGHNYFN